MAGFSVQAAFQAAGDPAAFPEDGLSPWQPQKLYYTAFARSDFLRLAELSREHGITWGDEEQEESEEWLDFTVPDEAITTRIDVLSYRSRTREAMRAHRTQIAPDDPWLNFPEEVAGEIMGADTFVRARSLVPSPVPEDDLFAGLRRH